VVGGLTEAILKGVTGRAEEERGLLRAPRAADGLRLAEGQLGGRLRNAARSTRRRRLGALCGLRRCRSQTVGLHCRSSARRGSGGCWLGCTHDEGTQPNPDRAWRYRQPAKDHVKAPPPSPFGQPGHMLPWTFWSFWPTRTSHSTLTSPSSIACHRPDWLDDTGIRKAWLDDWAALSPRRARGAV